MSRDHQPLSDVTADTAKHGLLYSCVRVFRAWPGDDVPLLLRVGTCLRCCGLVIRIHVTILSNRKFKYKNLSSIFELYIILLTKALASQNERILPRFKIIYMPSTQHFLFYITSLCHIMFRPLWVIIRFYILYTYNYQASAHIHVFSTVFLVKFIKLSLVKLTTC
jgi:hypothetical protein